VQNEERAIDLTRHFFFILHFALIILRFF